ncbi:Transcriptional activator HlyU [Rhodobacteraceae bacterium THAF1]|uniref:HlyU family transcriptional regulator n=1 Tax=Palleronia sp. THAF1 TaxID=2587842 RepID=UPI000F3BB099|nr:HlyU family transcriptional regulator [Palleronia sp. THAF1]QFU07996.1 Transcriptional activator HlyU [Palleronia sp. THAF1]VDC27847.1 Transcriptional activator HlyU [Rhodobacteraceae bacterium THAF1]
MSIFGKLFGGKSKTPQDLPGEEHKGYTIRPAPVAAEGGYRIAADIEKDGRTHHMVRADVVMGEGEARSASVAKARQVIDQLGEDIFR